MWHDTWGAMRGEAITKKDVSKRVGRKLSAVQMAAARKATGVRGVFRHGRYEYKETEASILVWWFKATGPT